MLSCSDWLPYMWSLNLLLLAENSHMALALWQAGMADEAFRIFKGTLLDSMFMGLCPGDFHMTSALDAHRQESQRDFGDPIGITSRALVEGLFGIQPNLIANSIRIRPGFPTDWNRASLHHKDFDLAWKREALQRDSYEFTSRLAKSVPLTLILPARTTTLPTVLCNGTRVKCAFDPNAVGSPQLIIHLPAARACKVSVEWHRPGPIRKPLPSAPTASAKPSSSRKASPSHRSTIRSTRSPTAASHLPASTPSSPTCTRATASGPSPSPSTRSPPHPPSPPSPPSPQPRTPSRSTSLPS